MVLTDELFNLGKDSKDRCIYLNENYILLRKRMPIIDEYLDEYITSIKNAKESGINIASIVDYKFIENTTSKNNYTLGVFIEDRAKGDCISSNDFVEYLETDKDIDYEQITKEYLRKTTDYLIKLETRAKANQNIYDKYIKDLLKLNDYNLTFDPKPLNFFFDKNIGYTIIDVIPSDIKEIENEYFPNDVFLSIFGYGKPILYIGNTYYPYLPKELNVRFQKAINELSLKISIALKNNGIKEEYVNKGMEEYLKNFVILTKENIEDDLKRVFKEEKLKEKEKPNDIMDINSWR